MVATLVTPRTSEEATAVGVDAATGEVRWRTPLPLDGPALPRPEVLQGVVAYELNVRRANGYDCRVALLSRATGEILQTVSHPSIGKASFQRADFQGPWTVLWAPTRADAAVYAGTPAKPR